MDSFIGILSGTSILFLFLTIYLFVKNNGKRDKINILETKLSNAEKKLKQGTDDSKPSDYEELIKWKAKSELEIKELKSINKKLFESKNSENSGEGLSNEQKVLSEVVLKLKKEIGDIKEYQELSESGLYSYKFKFQDVEHYNDALHIIKQAQKQIVKEGKAFICEAPGLTGSPIVKNLSKLSLLAFNSGADLITKNVRYNNFESCESKLKTLFEKVNNHLSSFNSYISEDFFISKLKEMALALEYELEKQKIK